MLSKIYSCTLNGLDGNITDVEVDISNGLPSFIIVGLPDLSVKESKERIRAAIKNSGFEFPMKRITVNLAPANTKKEGTHFDLAIALGILKAHGQMDNGKLDDMAFVGELSLDGKINRIDGALPLVLALRNNGIKKVVLPKSNKREAGMVRDVKIYPFNNLKDVTEYLQAEKEISHYVMKSELEEASQISYKEDFGNVFGQAFTKRALQIAAAGGHNVLMIGPPGSGKTMLARSFPSILPSMTYEECLEVTKIYSVAGELTDKVSLINKRPFRAPHHTISSTALVGGGKMPKPGEVSLAHDGVLFLDEVLEFKKSALEMLRQPIEDEIVTISRVRATITYPSNFILIASMNPCPCGYYGDTTHECTCTSSQIKKYLSKISGPLLDRIDMHVEVFPIKYEELTSNRRSKGSDEIRKEVQKARIIQLKRYSNESILNNAQLNTNLIKKYCKLGKVEEELMKDAFDKLKLSARAYNRIIKLSRTIADLDGSEELSASHIAEAIQYRNLDKKFWSV